MANNFEFTDWLCMEGLRTLINKSAIAGQFNTDYNKEFTKAFPVGEAVRVPLPQRFLIRDGIRYSDQPLNRRHTSVTVDQLFGVDFQWDTVEGALKMGRDKESIKKEYLDPAMEQIQAELDQRAANYAMLHTNNIVGALGTNPTAFSTFLDAERVMFENSCPTGDKSAVLSAATMASFVGAQTLVFNPQADASKRWRTGLMGQTAGMDFYRSNHLYTHTAGTWGGAVTVTSAPANGATSLTITATAGDTFKVGNVISVDAVNNANPVTRRSMGALKRLVVTQDLTAVGGGADVLYVSAGGFPLEGPGSQYQNVDALPAAGAALTLFPGTASPNGKSGVNGLVLHRNAFALVGVAMEKPAKAELASMARDPETGIAIRFVRDWNNEYSRFENRFDLLCGFGTLYADNCAVRIASGT